MVLAVCRMDQGSFLDMNREPGFEGPIMQPYSSQAGAKTEDRNGRSMLLKLLQCCEHRREEQMRLERQVGLLVCSLHPVP